MQAHLVFQSDEIEKLLALDSEAEQLAVSARAEAGADVCGVVRQVLPLLKVVQSIICILPFTKKACDAVKTAISLLETACAE